MQQKTGGGSYEWRNRQPRHDRGKAGSDIAPGEVDARHHAAGNRSRSIFLETRIASAATSRIDEVDDACGSNKSGCRTKSGHLREAGDAGGRMATSRPTRAVDEQLVVADQPRKQPAPAAMIDQRQRQRRSCPSPMVRVIRMPRSPIRIAVAWMFSGSGGRHARPRSAFGRQRDDEARALDVAGLGAGDVLGGQRAAMGFDDLPGYRQAKARILAERLAGRAVGVEALEDAVDGVGADARARCRRR